MISSVEALLFAVGSEGLTLEELTNILEKIQGTEMTMPDGRAWILR